MKKRNGVDPDRVTTSETVDDHASSPSLYSKCASEIDDKLASREFGGDADMRPARVHKFRHAVIPIGSWPRRMEASLAAAYCGENSVNSFLLRVGKEYPQPRVSEGRRKLWLRDDLDAAILPPDLTRVRDVSEDL